MGMYENITAAIDSNDIDKTREVFGDLAKALMCDIDTVQDGGYPQKWAEDMYAALHTVLMVTVLLFDSGDEANAEFDQKEADAFVEKIVEEYKNGV